MAKKETYEEYEEFRARMAAKPRISIRGVTPDECAVIRAALRLYRTRNEEKHTERPNMGWGEQARIAWELEHRLE